MNDRATWNQEYTENDAIPSSRRNAVSLPFTAAEPVLDLDTVDHAVDVGCGNGRHTAYLAAQGIDVTAIDFADKAVEMTQERIEDEDIVEQVTVEQADLLDGIPADDDSADLIVDSYVSCHFLEDEELDDYMEEVERVLKPDGLLYWSGLGADDGYYGELDATHPRDDVVVDPLNDVAKRLYTQKEVRNGIPGAPEAIYTAELRFDDFVADRVFERDVLAGVYRFNQEQA